MSRKKIEYQGSPQLHIRGNNKVIRKKGPRGLCLKMRKLRGNISSTILYVSSTVP